MIEVRSLKKAFGKKIAVDSLSFSVEKGEVLGLIGPNGAGKSTTMKMVSGCLRPTAGTVLLKQKDIWKQPKTAKRQLGFLPESAPSYDDLTVQEFIRYIAAIRKLRGAELKNAVERAIDLCFLENVRHQSIDTLSKGYRHRICLAQSIVHDPEIIIFDEPTDGLDPNQKTEIRGLIENIRKDKAIVLSTHILDEVDALCTKLVLINKGKLIVESTPRALREQSTQAKTLVITVSSSIELLIPDLEIMQNIVSVTTVNETTLHLLTSLKEESEVACLIKEIHALAKKHNWPLLELFILRERLEDIFRHLTLGSS